MVLFRGPARKDPSAAALHRRAQDPVHRRRPGRHRGGRRLPRRSRPARPSGWWGSPAAARASPRSSMMRLIPDPPGRIVAGRILFEGEDLLELSPSRRCAQSAANRDRDDLPGADDLAEPRLHRRRPDRRGAPAPPARSTAPGRQGTADRACCEQVGIPDSGGPRRSTTRTRCPGGMRQRVMIAMALACNPDAADRRRADHRPRRHHPGPDPRAAPRACRRSAGMAVLLITHDLGVVAETLRRRWW